MVSKNKKQHWHLCCEQILTRLCRCSVWLQCAGICCWCAMTEASNSMRWHVYSAHTEVISLMAFSSLTRVANYKALFHNRKNCLNKIITIVNTKRLNWLPKKVKNRGKEQKGLRDCKLLLMSIICFSGRLGSWNLNCKRKTPPRKSALSFLWEYMSTLLSLKK